MLCIAKQSVFCLDFYEAKLKLLPLCEEEFKSMHILLRFPFLWVSK